MNIYNHVLLIITLKNIYTCKYINKVIQNNISKFILYKDKRIISEFPHNINKKYNFRIKKKNCNKIQEREKKKRRYIYGEKIKNGYPNFITLNFSYINNYNMIKKKNKVLSEGLSNKMRNVKRIRDKVKLDSLNEENKMKNVYSSIINNSPIIIKNYEKRWIKLDASTNDLKLKYCLLIGQEFCFNEVEKNMYIGLLNIKKIYLFKETEEDIFYQCLYDDDNDSDNYNDSNNNMTCTGYSNKDDKNILKKRKSNNHHNEVYNFFNLHFPLNENIEIWKKKDQRMKEITNKMTGLRILKTDPVESFFSFLCSTNNNIPRITLMIDSLRRRYGKFIATVVFKNGDIIIKRDDQNVDGNNIIKLKLDDDSNEHNGYGINIKGEIKNGECKIKNEEFKIKNGECKIKNGECKIKNGEIKIKNGECKIKNGECKIKNGECKIKNGECKIKNGVSQINDIGVRIKKEREIENNKSCRVKKEMLDTYNADNEIGQGNDINDNVNIYNDTLSVTKEDKRNKKQNKMFNILYKNEVNKIEKKDLEMLSKDNKIFYESLKTTLKEERNQKTFHFYEFPKIQVISKLKENDLRSLGFGYRSNYVIECAKMLVNMGEEEWIENLKNEEKTKTCIDKLIQFPGIGLKVANCICLFGLNKYDCIPIDTHIYDIIYKYYNNFIEPLNKSNKKNKTIKNANDNNNSNNNNIKNIQNNVLSNKTNIITDKKHINKKLLSTTIKKKKTLTNSLYVILYNKLRNLFGPNCGWAQTILFASELKKFSHVFE
ncbi:N-glycosylase/DNA lyase, putative [Plasmodium reichenowi]|uniref:DNA-(apurinic or apyrimidinic site) lyase n=1 Tax=Plasmodium reichenowi TaxID=5854 RepID=A0A2P9DCX3_PLARE|nr:N-glycosylase/DNA lyase, putative [Plasmodium reichenowi]